MTAFKYPLEPLRERAQWQLEAVRLKLAQLEKTMVDAHLELSRVVDEMNRIAAESIDRQGASVDPIRQRRLVDYLATMRTRIDERRSAIQGLQQASDHTRADCLEKQKQLEVTEQHRKTMANEHAHLEVARSLREADADWIAREAWKKS